MIRIFKIIISAVFGIIIGIGLAEYLDYLRYGKLIQPLTEEDKKNVEVKK